MNNSILKNSMQVDKDLANRKITITRNFDAPVSDVWKAWTTKELLDQWWAPKPWKAKSKAMDFRVGGHWLYAMVGPDGTTHWARIDYTAIDPEKSFSGIDAFCDENGSLNKDLPAMNWDNNFRNNGDGTEVRVVIQFDSSKDLQAIIDMGFEQGFTAALQNLDELLASK